MQRQEGSTIQMWYAPSPVLHHASRGKDAAVVYHEMLLDT